RARLVGGERNAHRLQRHATKRAAVGLVADHLRMHRARILSTLRHGFRCRPVAEVLFRIGLELLETTRRAEIEFFALVAQEVPRAGAVHIHPTHRILGNQMSLWIGRKLLPARLTTEMIDVFAMAEGWLASVWINRHPAYGIACDALPCTMNVTRAAGRRLGCSAHLKLRIQRSQSGNVELGSRPGNSCYQLNEEIGLPVTGRSSGFLEDSARGKC